MADVFQRPATLRVAELLGLHNIGEGIVRADGAIETPTGLRLPCADTSLAAGSRVMWRVSPRALVATQEGAWQGCIAGTSLRHGDRYVTVEIAGETFDIAAEDAPASPTGMLRFSIKANGVLAWPASHGS